MRADVQRKVREAATLPAREPRAGRRTVADLCVRVEKIREKRRVAAARRLEAERRQQEEQAERLRRAFLKAVRRQGEKVWGDIETEIGKRNARGYDRAAGLLFDLRTLAEEDGTIEEFSKRVQSIRDRHPRKRRFLDRLKDLP